MNNNMVEFKIRPFTKCVVLKLDIFETHIIDEANFSISDKEGVEKFLSKYIDNDDYIVVEVDM